SAADDSGRIAEVLNPPKPLQDGIASAGRSADSRPADLAELVPASLGNNGKSVLDTENAVPALKQFEPKTGRESLYAGLKEVLNTALGNTMTNGVVQHVTGTHLSASQFGIDAALSGLMAGGRQTIYHWSSMGQQLAYRNIPEGAPASFRWLAETPNSWAYFAAYMTLKDAVKNGIYGKTTPTEIDPASY
ncbi:hypothetical protein ACIOWI_37000, partial [Streptomyces sp. NPDC087659]|uniref:hypothetical protein n=1 Tax=Streptomyces sp. NPDC087659 TaxID=3365801 RepID=UPI00381A886E